MKKLSRQGVNKFFKQLVFAGCLATLAACGGGSRGGDHKEELNQKPQAFPLSVQVNGLTKQGLVLQNNGGDDLVIAADGAHNFSKPVSYRHNYAVTVIAQPADVLCTVKNGSGIAVAAIPAISVVCSSSDKTYTVGGTVTGLDPGQKVTLANNDGSALNIDANKPFTF